MFKESKEKNTGVFFVIGHFSNWELNAYSFSGIFNERLNIVAKIQANKVLNRKIKEYREKNGNHIIEIGLTVKSIFRKLKSRESVCFLIDQSAHSEYSAYINFFGKSVPSFSGPAKIALIQRPELVMGYSKREEDYTYTVNFENIAYADLRDSSEKNIIELTQRMQTKLENFIRENPEQWLWFHKRFKHSRN